MIFLNDELDKVTFLLNYYKNNNNKQYLINRFSNESIYLSLFEYYSMKKYTKYTKYIKTLFDLNLNKDQILYSFIKKIDFLEYYNIKLSCNNFRLFLKILYVNNNSDSIEYNFCSSDFHKINEIKMNLINYLYKKYNEYFKYSHFYFIYLIECDNFYMIKKFFEINYTFNEETYKFILENNK
jgi:hypothetical protein